MSLLDRIRERPPRERQGIAFGVAGAITLLILVLWGVSFSVSLKKAPSPSRSASDAAPFDSFFSSFEDATATFQEGISTLNEGLKDINQNLETLDQGSTSGESLQHDGAYNDASEESFVTPEDLGASNEEVL